MGRRRSNTYKQRTRIELSPWDKYENAIGKLKHCVYDGPNPPEFDQWLEDIDKYVTDLISKRNYYESLLEQEENNGNI